MLLGKEPSGNTKQKDDELLVAGGSRYSGFAI